jgi:cystathionine beta-lyase/cystathionine gamma-synthase
MKTKTLKPHTSFIHAGRDRDPYTGGSSIPIYQASTFAQPDPEHPGAYDYARSGNPTREALELAIAELEGGAVGLAFASGMAAITSALLLFKPGDHLVASEDIYGGTYRVLTKLFTQWGLQTTFVNMADLEAVERAIRPSTRALFVETPSNPLLKITDLKATAGMAKAHGILAIIDNTFQTPWLQRPLEHGFDLVLHSATKFIGGHSDVIAGLAVTRDEELGRALKAVQNSAGTILGPQDSWLVLRGSKTLGVRMDRQQATAATMARELQTWRGVRAVHYPGLAGHPGRAIHRRQSSGGGAVLSFEVKDRAAALRVLKRVRLMLPAVSLGGVDSILSYPAMMSHAAMPVAERHARGIADGLLRLSVGLEAAEDLLADLEQAVKLGNG